MQGDWVPLIEAWQTEAACPAQRAPQAWRAAPLRPGPLGQQGWEGRGWAEQWGWEQGCVPLRSREARSGSGSPASVGLSPGPPRARGQMGALGRSGPSACSGPVAPEMPRLGMKPEEGQILLPKHKGPTLRKIKELTRRGCHGQVSWGEKRQCPDAAPGTAVTPSPTSLSTSLSTSGAAAAP